MGTGKYTRYARIGVIRSQQKLALDCGEHIAESLAEEPAI